MEIYFVGKRVLVTGGGKNKTTTTIFKGIGRATTLALARCGAEVMAVTSTQACGVSVNQAVCVDLGDWGATEEALREAGGTANLLVNNMACVMLEPFLEVTPDQFDLSFNINGKAALHVSQVDDVVNSILLFLLSDESSMTNGVTLSVDGAFLAC